MKDETVMGNQQEEPLWTPSPERIAGAAITRFMREAGAHHGLRFADYAALHRWSIDHMADFWREIWSFCGVIGDGPGERTLVNPDAMPGARFFPDAKINFAENLLRRRDGADALVFRGEDKVQRRMTYRELADEVSRVQQALSKAGVGEGDRVCAIIANMPEAIIGMLATSSLGAIWSSCSPDFGVQGILDRFGQIEPRVLFAVDGYYYNGKTIDILGKVAEVRSKLPSVQRVVIAPYVSAGASLTAIASITSGVWWGDFTRAFQAQKPTFVRLPFNHPLYILYSSGTTGVPKCIVHGAGGTLVQHLKEQQLQCDFQRDDRVFYFTTCGWMMWNWLATGLATGATLLLYDGSPFFQEGKILWEFAQAERMTHFGTSAKYIDAVKKAGLRPMDEFDLTTVRTILSTGSPLAPESFDCVYQCIKRDVCLSSMSGGTDIVASFVGGSPILPVYRGEIQCKVLGMAVESFDEDGKPYPPGSGQRGELVCTRPFPSMPIGFWNDPGDVKYRAAYYEQFPGVWCHGDFVEITARGGTIIYGRSDATLNPGGVRIGTAEIYRQVEQLDEVVESLVIGQDWDHDVRVVLFVRLRDGLTLEEALVNKIKQHIRNNTTPRHVPAKVLQVADIPRTKSNKIVELAVRNIVHGRPVKNVEALANPEALDEFRDRPELRA
jgi:acetoacetyl-CoA synthetase